MPARIIVVLDKPDFAAQTAEALLAAGHDAAALPDPMAALTALENAARIELLVTCPEFAAGQPNGISLTLMARTRRPDIKALFIGAEQFVPYTEGLGSFMASPVTVLQIVDAVTQMLRTDNGGGTT